MTDGKEPACPGAGAAAYASPAGWDYDESLRRFAVWKLAPEASIVNRRIDSD